MLSFVRTISIAPGTMGAALTCAREVTAHRRVPCVIRKAVMKPVAGKTSRLIAAASMTLSMPAMPAAAQRAGPVTSADAAMALQRGQEYKNLGPRTWVNPMMPAATGGAAAIAAPADHLLQQRLAGSTRNMLDRGGWRNTRAPDSHYAAGEPLLAAAVGSGITSAAAEPAVPQAETAARLVPDYAVFLDPPTGFVFVKLPAGWKFVGTVDATDLARIPEGVLTALLADSAEADAGDASVLALRPTK